VGQAQAWFQYVRDGIYFFHDPVNTEWLQSARYTLTCGSGDCDDRAILLAAGLSSFGVPTQFKLVAVDASRPQSFSHVYVSAFLGNRWVAMDPTYRQNTLGTEPPQRFRTWMVPA
jgi:transglutaminase-like putative cysteine protease